MLKTGKQEKPLFQDILNTLEAHYDSNDLCAHFNDQGSALVRVATLGELHWDSGTCGFGIVNLSPCVNQWINYAQITSICNNMLGQCVINGNDGLATDAQDKMAYAIYGVDAPPAYPSPSAC